MPLGAGKYDDVCTSVRNLVDAQIVYLGIVNGTRGSGFSVQVMAKDPADHALILETLVKALRATADEIEREMK